MAGLKKRDINKNTETTDFWNQDSGSNGFLSSFLMPPKAPDYDSFMALAKEISRHLKAFNPPEGFRPQVPPPTGSLSAAAVKALGAKSLKDFFSLALEAKEAHRLKNKKENLPPYFPIGPELVPQAFDFVESKRRSVSKALGELHRNWPKDEGGLEAAIRPLKVSLDALLTQRAALRRIERDLWPRMKEEALQWPKDAKLLWHTAQNLKQSVSPLLKAGKAAADGDNRSGFLDRRRTSLNRIATLLRKQLGKAKGLADAETAWNISFDAFLTELDDYMAVAVDGNQAHRNWESDKRWLSTCLSKLEKEDGRLGAEILRAVEALSEALDDLIATESRLAGHKGTEIIESFETVGRGVQALWCSTVERRRQMARVYFAFPSRVGRPEFLEKSMLATAQALGRAQTLLEELRHNLHLAGGRLSSSQRLREEAKILIELLRKPSERQRKIKIAIKRLNVLEAVIDQNFSLLAAKGELKDVVAKSAKTEQELNRGRAENSRMYRELKVAAFEREHLTDQLTAARHKLTETGHLKARLLKVFAQKSAVWDEIEKSRHGLMLDNEALKLEKSELKLKRAKLAKLYSKERLELKKLNDHFREHQVELLQEQGYIELKNDLERRLDETKKERDALYARSREVESQLNERSAQLASAAAKADSLSVELARYREELAATSKARLNLGEQAAALRRRQDVLAQAQSSLKNALRRKSGQLRRSEEDCVGLNLKLNRQKKNILRLVSERQQLRAELASARLTIFDLEKERDNIFTQLKVSQEEFLNSEQTNTSINSLVQAMFEEKKSLITQLQGVMQESGELESRLKKLQEDFGHEKMHTDNLAQERDLLFSKLKSLENESQERFELDAAKIKEMVEEKDAFIKNISELEAEIEKTASMERERNELQFRLNSVELEKGHLASLLSDLEIRNKELASQLKALESQVSEDLFPFIKILGEALWQSEVQLKRAQSASKGFVERFKWEFQVREANVRLQSAGREMERNAASEAEKAEMKKRLENLESEREFLFEERDKFSRHNDQMRQAMGNLKERYSLRLDEAKEEQSQQQQLFLSQENELKVQNEKLAKLEPLIAYFIASVEENDDSASVDIDPELLLYLKDIGKILGSELASDEDINSSGRYKLAASSVEAEDIPLIARLKARLNEVKPLVSFLARSYVASVADLAQARQERSSLSDELSKIKQERAEEDLEPDILLLDNQISTQDHEENILAAPPDAFIFSEEKNKFEESLVEKDNEINLLKKGLAQADRELAENDGKLESAWAALNYLDTKTKDAQNILNDKIKEQDQKLEGLSIELGKRDAIIINLEERQNKLALLYWTLVSRASEAEPGQLAAQSSPFPTALLESAYKSTVPTSLETDNSFSIKGFDILQTPAFVADKANKSGGYSLKRGILEGVKRVARRSLLTLVLAGGLVMGSSFEAEALEAPRLLNKAVLNSSKEAVQLSSRLDSAYIGRTVSLEKIDAKLRLEGQSAVETHLAEIVSKISAGHGLTNGEFLRLLRSARGPEHSIQLDDFIGRKGALELLLYHFPKLCAQMNEWSSEVLSEKNLSDLMRAASDFKTSEGSFWERIYFDLLAVSHSQAEALDFILDSLEHKKDKRALKPEFAGRLAPFQAIENLGPERFISFMANYINESWPKTISRGRQQASSKLAADIYFASRHFKLPDTLLASLLHQEAEADQEDFFSQGATLAIHARAADLADLTKSFTFVWQESRPPLCDLDDALAASEKESFVENVYRKKMALVMGYNKTINAGGSLFDEL